MALETTPRGSVCPTCGLPPDAAGPSGYVCKRNHRWGRNDNGQVMAPEAVLDRDTASELKRQAATRMAQQPGPAKAEPEREFSTWLDLAKLLGPIRWDWERWISPGFVHLVAGASGQGKSMVLLRIAATYLRGDPWPDGAPFDGEQGAVVWAECEGAEALNVDRAGKWGLPLGRILSPLGDPLAEVDLANSKHRAHLEANAKRPEVRLVVIDSLSGARPRADENDSRGLQAMKWIANLARDAAKPVLIAHHFKKRGPLDEPGRIDLDRLRGSTALVQVARLVWCLDAPDPAQREALRLQVIKSNLAKFPEPLGMRITDDGRVEFGEAPRKLSEEERAADFLRTALRSGPVRATDLQERAEEAGVSWRAAKRAKLLAGVDSYKKGAFWYWFLPGEGSEPELEM